ncbi:MAG TPA: MATE family efflux transporter, partial [Thermoanaerobaculia bacterium]
MTSEEGTGGESETRREIAAMVRLSVPIVITQVGLMLMGIVDTVMLGHYSARALAAGALANLLTYSLLVLGNGTLGALDPLVSQAFGAGDLGAIGGHLQRGLVLGAFLAIPLGLFLWNLRPILTFLGQRPEVAIDAAAYCRALVWGNVALFFVVAFRQTLQAMSVVRPALVAIVIGNLVNALGNWVLIFGHFGFPPLGVVGSAHATSAARWAMFVCILVASRRALAKIWRGFTAEAVDLRRHLRLLRLGLPIGL